ncbi:DNA-3-methyladenine glycosylase I [Faunimonas sp. B44]|uniref:DNA-3-methyladenine glycosylase I n=1 Tax=Faunimonas sp. B44 TaxID=3461493 RepID=UPI004044DF5A
MAVTLADGLAQGSDGRCRCWWPGGDPLYRAYHDTEWGRPVADDVRLFEKICLEGFQSGLSWLTILRKRENFRAAFAGFRPAAIAGFGADDVARCLADSGIVRHRGKIESVVNNARRALDLAEEAGSIAAFVWRFEPPPESRPARMDRGAIVPQTEHSLALSKALRKRGWSFVGPTTMHAFMQAVGIVNDHLEGCFCRAEAEAERRAFVRPA